MIPLRLRVGLLVAVAALLAGCVSHHDDSLTPGATGTVPVTTPASVAINAPTPLPAMPVKLSADASLWMVPGSTFTATAALPPEASAPITYTWLYGAMGGTVPITVPAQTQTGLIPPGASAPMKFDQAGIFYEHCHPHPWMLSTVVVLDDGRPAQTVTVHFIDGAKRDEFQFVPAYVVVPKGSTVIYENDGKQAHQTMLMKQDAPLAPLSLKDASGTLTASGTGWMRVLVIAQDSVGHIGSAEKDVYVQAMPAPTVQNFSGQFNVTLPSQAPAQLPAPLGSTGDVYGISSNAAGHIWVNFTSLDGVAQNAPTDPAGDTSQIQVALASKDGSFSVASAPADKGSVNDRVAAGSYGLTVTPVAGELVRYTVTVTLQYDLVPPKAAPYTDPTEQVAMGGAASAGM